MTRLLSCYLALLAAIGSPAAPSLAGSTDDCGGATVMCGVHADPLAGDFHGLVAATTAPWVLATAARSGTTAGCGDCTWRLALACPTASPTDPAPPSCAGDTNALVCRPGQLLYRLYLSDVVVTDEVVGELCVGGPARIVPIGDQARADLARYLKTVTPPAMTITVRPRHLTLAGLSTRFRADPRGSLRQAPFGGPEVSELITLRVERTRWKWGDGSATGWQDGSPSTEHRYLHAGQPRLRLTARWGATYLVDYDGQTFGPYDATGQVAATQTRVERVGTSQPVLVSG